nr:hypothetical protein [Achromobacter marplatensis]
MTIDETLSVGLICFTERETFQTDGGPRIVNCRLPAAAFGIRYSFVGLLPAFTLASHGVSLP